MSNTTYRQKMITALEATGADGASIHGTESDVLITITFRREKPPMPNDWDAQLNTFGWDDLNLEKEVKPCTKSCSDSPSLTCSGICVNNDSELPGETELPLSTAQHICDAMPPIFPKGAAKKAVEMSARRMWKRWLDEKHELIFLGEETETTPVTILPGHDAVEEIEREAYGRGWDDGCRFAARDTLAIDGVDPTVVDYPNNGLGYITLYGPHGPEKHYDTPCRILVYPGIGPDGKRAGGRE